MAGYLGNLNSKVLSNSITVSNGKTSLELSAHKRGLSLKSNEAVAWMQHYFER